MKKHYTAPSALISQSVDIVATSAETEFSPFCRQESIEAYELDE